MVPHNLEVVFTIQSNKRIATVAIPDTQKRCHAIEFGTELVARSLKCDRYVLVPESVWISHTGTVKEARQDVPQEKGKK